MLNLFKIEWLKIRSYRTFWILFLAFVILYPVAFYFTAYKTAENFTDTGNMQEEMLKTLIESPFTFPKVWWTSAWMGGMFFILMGMLFILLVTNEVQYRTHRQNIIDGWSRLDFLKAKFSVMIFFVVTSTILVFISGLLVGLIFSASKQDIFDRVYYVGYFAMMATLYLMVAYATAILIKRTGLAIIIYFAFVCIVDNILYLILTLNGNQVGYFLPMEATDSLVPFPFKPRMMERRTVEDYYLIIAAVLYITAWGYLLISYFKKIDLKT